MDNSFFSRFAPKDSKFFPVLKQLADVMSDASDLLAGSLQCSDLEERKVFYQKIKDKERLGDDISHHIFDELSDSFVTPFDREDIHTLADYLDDVIDRINSCAKRIATYNPKGISNDSIELGKIVSKDAECIGKAMDEIAAMRKNAVQLKARCKELHDLENKADDIYDMAIIRLFQEEKDGIEIVKNKDILNELEKATDAAERVGKILKTMIVKYA